MVRRFAATVGTALLLGACGTPALSSSGALDHVRDSLAEAGIDAQRIRLADAPSPGTFRAVARVDDGQISVTIDRDSGAYRRIEVSGDAATDRQIRALAEQRADAGTTRARVRQIGVTVALLVTAAAIGLGLARRARLNEERAPVAT